MLWNACGGKNGDIVIDKAGTMETYAYESLLKAAAIFPDKYTSYNLFINVFIHVKRAGTDLAGFKFEDINCDVLMDG